jgi:hypothetical protein
MAKFVCFTYEKPAHRVAAYSAQKVKKDSRSGDRVGKGVYAAF